jgi:outer membrane protein OmpA-like peptidoglycan-associated protein
VHVRRFDHDRSRGGRRAPIAVLAAAALVVAGCGGGHKKGSTATTAPTTTRSSTAAATPPKPIATVNATTAGAHGPDPFQVTIYDLRRAGSFLVLDFGVQCLNASGGCDLSYAFAPGYKPTAEIQYDEFSVAGIGLVDPTNLKEYLPVRDGQLRPYVSVLSPGSGSLDDSLIHLAWVRYPLPPAGTTSLDVAFPDGGPLVENVPITAGAGPTAAGHLQPAQPAPFAQPPTSTNASGLTLPVENLIASSGNATGSDSESPGQAQITLRSDVLFHFAKSNLTPKARTILRSVAQQIKARARGPVQITGYTDSIGTDAVNIPLSQARARSVVSALTPLTPGITYNAEGKGSADPVAPNTKPDGSDNPAGRALNRRVTIVFAATAVRPTPPAPAAPAAGGPAAQAGSMTFKPSSVSSNTYTVSNAALYRSGNLLALTMTLACASVQGDQSCFPEADLAGIATVPPEPVFGGEAGSQNNAAQALFSLSAFYLLDPATGAEYVPVRRTDAVPLTTFVVQSIPVGTGYRVWLYFSAPPASTTSLTLLSPGGNAKLGPISISSAPAP